ncbi:nucleoside-diphosphate-sugar epimerase [Candidatus Scalindua japonica]|uniref:Nucleoside-diphosphate-sugar epimerase n=1 Tax=Candidatus Scalindua japonica TaxID=1284222 RepID=A0A286TX37_9BACT|nr:NAD(P)H-binding protein [Candidatus Scalindua japonica]GAX60438.1 nucleoside-diphosphate-sugar epimerase [Candidatus Scalindua japonica]
MNKRILVIGAHGVLGRPVVRRLVKKGFNVRALSRHTSKASAVLPEEVEIVHGDLRDINSLIAAAQNVEIIYLNLATYAHSSPFRPELDGTCNVLKAVEDRKDILIAKISGFGITLNMDWPDAFQKFQAEEAIRSSGHPFLITRPTVFMETLPLFLRGRLLLYAGHQPFVRYWIAGDDYARQLVDLFQKPACWNKMFNIQGCKALTFREAALRFAKAFDPRIKVISIPLLALRIAVFFRLARPDAFKSMNIANNIHEPFQSLNTWEELGRPRMSIEDYVHSIRTTGDIPRRHRI